MKLRPAIQKKRPAIINAGVVLIHNNATHMNLTPLRQQLTTIPRKYSCTVSYSPDLSPSDYDLFPKLKMSLREVRFEDLDELKITVATELHLVA